MTSDTRQFGTYATLRLKLAEPLTAVLGSRVSWYRNSSDSYTRYWNYWQPNRSQENGQVTPFAALIYDLDDTWSVYASYADIFQPQSTYAKADGSSLKPKTGASYEVGSRPSGTRVASMAPSTCSATPSRVAPRLTTARYAIGRPTVTATPTAARCAPRASKPS